LLSDAAERRRQNGVGAPPPPIVGACYATADPHVIGAQVYLRYDTKSMYTRMWADAQPDGRLAVG